VVPELPPLPQRTLQRLIRAFSPERVLLFGSYAKASVQPTSDVDLLVIADVDENVERHQRLARQLASDSFPRVDVVIATPAEVAGASLAKSPFLASILATGVVVYKRDPGGRHPGPVGPIQNRIDRYPL
jgi:uncharacterized protein